MIKSETLNNETLIRHYSDANMMILQNETGIKYPEAVDVIPCRYTYTETDEPIKKEEATEEGIIDEVEIMDTDDVSTDE